MISITCPTCRGSGGRFVLAAPTEFPAAARCVTCVGAGKLNLYTLAKALRVSPWDVYACWRVEASRAPAARVLEALEKFFPEAFL